MSETTKQDTTPNRYCHSCGCTWFQDSGQPICPQCTPLAPPTPVKGSILLEAEQLINGPRRDSYGPYTDEAKAVAAMWSALLKFEVKPRLVPLMLIALKLHRESHKHSVDNLRDTCGYAALAQQVVDASGEKP